MSFSVECSNDPRTRDAAVDRNYYEFDEAVKFAEHACTKYRAVWISETGINKDSGREDWFCFWWNQIAETDGGYGRPERRGKGYQYSKSWVELVEYEPINELSEYTERTPDLEV